MRSLFALFLAASIIALCACGSSSKDEQEKPPESKTDSSAPAVKERAAELEKMRAAACGNPVQFPITERCFELSGKDGAVLKKENELTIAVWRNCALTPASAESIRRETIARGNGTSEMGRRIIGEMERTEQNSDSPCVRADMSDPDCIAGDMNACAKARSNSKACVAWFQDPDTQNRLLCLSQRMKSPVCTQAGAAQAGSSTGYFSDAQQLADDCRRAENSCLHTFDECADAKDALDKFMAQLKGAKPGAAVKPEPQAAVQSQPMDSP